MRLAAIDRHSPQQGVRIIEFSPHVVRQLRAIAQTKSSRLDTHMAARDELLIYYEPRKALAWQVFISDSDRDRAEGYAEQLRVMFRYLGKDAFGHMRASEQWIFFFRERRHLAMALLLSELPTVKMYTECAVGALDKPPV